MFSVGTVPNSTWSTRARHNLWVSGRAALVVVTSWLWVSACFGYSSDGRLPQHRSRAIRGVRLDQDHAIEVVHEYAQHPRVDTFSLAGSTSAAPAVAVFVAGPVEPGLHFIGSITAPLSSGFPLPPGHRAIPSRGPPSLL